MLLRDFIRDVTVVRKSKASARQFIDLAKNDFLIYASINTIGSTNILDVWAKYRNLLIAWLDTFIKEYEIRVSLGGLPIDYQARISLLTLLLLARDLIEAHDYVFDRENREIVNTPIVSGTRPYMTWLGLCIPLCYGATNLVIFFLLHRYFQAMPGNCSVRSGITYYTHRY